MTELGRWKVKAKTRLRRTNKRRYGTKIFALQNSTWLELYTTGGGERVKWKRERKKKKKKIKIGKEERRQRQHQNRTHQLQNKQTIKSNQIK